MHGRCVFVRCDINRRSAGGRQRHQSGAPGSRPRYDFKGSKAAIEFNKTDSTLTLVADDEFKMEALWEIVQAAW